MEFVMNMVHHNPGEPPFDTIFLNPENVKAFGGNAQVFKHINTVINFLDYDSTIFDNAKEELDRIQESGKNITAEIEAAKASGLAVYYHIDLFVLPKAVYNKYKDEICDENGKISLSKPKTLELHRAMLDEMFKRFPIDGLIIRVGETYLHDTPYHIGNGAVAYGDKEKEKADFIKLIEFLRTEVCIKHGKYLFFRTWDCFPDRFHAGLDYYLDITDKIEPHEKLLFSIKHTALDFWRRVKFNDCIGKGKHRQIIEVQCQREYEGKGAYPMYVMNGVINSFSENQNPIGLRDFADHPLVCGLYIWPRGGGWGGPYPKNEFWCELNTYVISQFGKNPHKTEEELFNEFALTKMGLAKDDLRSWRELCLIANEAVLHGRYIECYDRTLKESIMPCANWLRDCIMAGVEELKEVFEYLYKHDLLEAALCEKLVSYKLWAEVRDLFDKITIPDKDLSEFIRVSIDYGLLFFNIVYRAWKVMSLGYTMEMSGTDNKKALKEAISEYDKAWEEYRKLENNKYASTLYTDTYYNDVGLRTSVDKYRKMI